MLTILTGLPKDKKDDIVVCKKLLTSNGKKAICGSSTMKMYCRELHIEPKIEIINTAVPQVRYYIQNIDLASEGAITLNKCFHILKGNKDNDFQANTLAKLIKDNKDIHFIVGTAQTDTSLYKQNNIFPRTEIIKQITEFLNSNKFNVSLEFF